jgi:seryl-tRNA(Sec) selenium transferase
LRRQSTLRVAGVTAGCSFGILAAVIATVSLYLPSKSEMESLRTERRQLQASIDDLTKRGAKMKTIECGSQSRLCVLVDRAAGTFGVAGNKDDVYMIVKGY